MPCPVRQTLWETMARPTKPPKPGAQQVTISLRVPVSLKTALEERAAANYRNLSQEAERTLERSFSSEALFADVVRLMTEDSRAVDRFAEAVRWLRPVTNDLFGHRAGEAGLRLMQAMALRRMLTDAGMHHIHAAHPEDIEYFLEAVRELQGDPDHAGQQAPAAAPSKDTPTDVAHGKIREGVVHERPGGLDARMAEIRRMAKETKRLQSSVPRPRVTSKLWSERPLYLKVRDVLAARIAVGEWKPGTPIPKESELVREFGVSPETMRQALDLMEADDLLTRRAIPATRSKGAPKPHLYLVHPEAKSA